MSSVIVEKMDIPQPVIKQVAEKIAERFPCAHFQEIIRGTGSDLLVIPFEEPMRNAIEILVLLGQEKEAVREFAKALTETIGIEKALSDPHVIHIFRFESL